MRRIINGTDNRDCRTVILTLDNEDTVDVDPWALIENVIENLGGDRGLIRSLQEQYEWSCEMASTMGEG